MQVKEVMTKDPACCTGDTPLAEVAKMMLDNDCGEIPVVDSQTGKVPVGVVTDRDIVCRTLAKGLNPVELTATACMSKPIVTVGPDTSLEECCRIMEEKMIRRVPVVDERGACVGIVALADIARQSSKSVAGEIVKEVSEPAAGAATA
ncbi:MAG TPA: CBS domain-containing protein [Pyrinomonadaceae bacterium]|jgi:CBS domain-containing protein|nr:CBS domain-containing protein [Pyrinomonadaceae bacterium]